MTLSRKTLALSAAVALSAPLALWGTASATAGTTARHATRHAGPTRVLIVLFDQMVPQYADQFAMPNFRQVRKAGTDFTKAYLGYTASETVMAHNVITSGQLPKHMGWTDEAYRDTGNLLGKGAGAMHITGDLSLADFGTLISNERYPKLADYLHRAHPGSRFIVVGEKSYAVESAAAPSGDIAVRLSGRSSGTTTPEGCRTTLGGRFRWPAGKAVPTYLAPTPGTDATSSEYCNRYYINSDSGLDYGTKAAFPSWLYPEEGNRFFPGTDPSSSAHAGGDTWVADAAISMMSRENWSGMFVTLGAIDKAGHMWGAQHDADTFTGSCTAGTAAEIGAAQTHVRCAAENADAQFGRILAAAKAHDAADGGETLVVLTADHGATFGENFYGKAAAGAGDSNWYWAPQGVYDGGVLIPSTEATYNTPSTALGQLNAKGNVQFSYQSTEIETWLVDHSTAEKKATAKTMLTLPGVTASYWRDGDHFVLQGQNAMTTSEKKWWKKHGQELVDAMAASNGPDVVGLLHDRTSYGVYGDHGGAQESVQRVPMVFWSRSLAEAEKSGAPITTPDILPTILRALRIPVTAPMDGRAWPIGD
jgi:hypothetical protein